MAFGRLKKGFELQYFFMFSHRAIRGSLISSGQAGATADDKGVTSYDEELQIALAMSEQEMMNKNSEDRSEDDELERILKLSLTDK